MQCARGYICRKPEKVGEIGLKCPECDYTITEDDLFCPACKVQLWSNKTLKSWDKLEVIRIVND